MLTILGYSLNDTVVIYDRIREVLRRSKRVPIEEVLDHSVNATLSRSVVTHVTVTLALLALLLFGGAGIHSFTATMLFGVVLVGTYTSIFIASPMLIYLGLRTSQASAEESTTDGEAVETQRAAVRSRSRSRRSRSRAYESH
jgi:preprotein translocase subunit SecF